MKTIAIECLNKLPVACNQEPVTIGVPFSQGTAVDTADLVLKNSSGSAVPLQAKALNYWPDGTCKWVLCDFLGDIPAAGQAEYFLDQSEKEATVPTGCAVSRKENAWTVDTGKGVFTVDAQVLRPFSSIQLGSGQEILQGAEVVLAGSEGEKWQSKVEQIILETTGPVRTNILLEGHFLSPVGRVNFVSRVHFYSGSARITFEVRLHNPAAAAHPGNLWDLGDPASVLLKEWSLQIHLKSSVIACQIRPDLTADWCDIPLTGGSLYQESSGGQNWDSPVHRDRSGDVPMSQPGWILNSDEHNNTGNRAQPTLLLETAGTQLTAAIDNFWQRFPKELSYRDSTLKIGLLPERFPAAHELQGGEQITELIRLDFSADVSSAWSGSKLQVRCGAATYIEAGVFGEGLWNPTDKNYKQLLDVALDTNNGFKAKREQTDEFGWRNFGELYADHESAQYQGEKPFVSHYNNQYDPLYSFYRLYLTGESTEWGDLADDLAAHIADIDINHTDEDREEYCHGPFWHTDHYLDAGLSTHRMASREHFEHKNPAFCGGGPGGEHCYSGGLALNYLLTGDERKKQLVLSLADWSWLFLHGPQTVGAVLLRGVKNFKKMRSMGNSIWPQFPLTRETGNCIHTILDAYELTGDSIYLVKSTKLIQGTFHPNDSLEARDLLNPEANWSYTVFLGAVGRYLYVKELNNQIDSDFNHACSVLLSFSHWMADHEYLYLDKPDILEYPNETWAAQDLRKGVVFYYAAKYADAADTKVFSNKAEFFLTSGLKYLSQQETNYYTRPLALVMQNGWVVEAITEEKAQNEYSVLPTFSGKLTPKRNIQQVICRSVVDFIRVLPQTSLKREWRWLKARIK